ncbi:DNA polymerase III subunit delta [Amaricoccus sp.]|uniref:DNA polymerase III subunit delta n=1 Tax=Amaricoccus sp. TaxID=1872485 RepID=UPI001B4A9A13|nr:DNA polymerase III subunit delta [Amaricoccus sp.]MBP7001294.1 DNA polymerase III subunit delta [Amaricoccus sp.]
MKLSTQEAARFLARPDPAVAAALLHGPDAMRTALRRQELVLALIGPEGAAEMRLTRLPAAELRRDPAAVQDAMRATGFFPGPRAVLVEDATETAAAALLAAVDDWRAGDATLVVAAGELKPANALRKGFEAARRAVAIAIHADPPGRAEIEAALARAGLPRPEREAFADLEALAQVLDPGDFAQTLEKLALYKLGDPTPPTCADLEAVAPAPPEAEIEEILHLAADGRADALARAMASLAGGSSAATGLVIAAGRHFRALHAAACAADDPEAALARARPPVFGPRRSRMAAQVRRLGRQRLEEALALITDADLTLRSSKPAPGLALAERLLVRIASMRRD